MEWEPRHKYVSTAIESHNFTAYKKIIVEKKIESHAANYST